MATRVPGHETPLAACVFTDGQDGDRDDPPDGSFADLGLNTPRAALRAFIDCMRHDDWVAADVDRIREEESASGSCASCHNSALAGDSLPDFALGPVAFYDAHRTLRGVVFLVALNLDGDGNIDGMRPSPGYWAQETGSHPPYELDPAVDEAIERFFDRTYARLFDERAACVRE